MTALPEGIVRGRILRMVSRMPPRPLLVAACQELGVGKGRLVADLAADTQEAGLALLRARVPPAAAERDYPRRQTVGIR